MPCASSKMTPDASIFFVQREVEDALADSAHLFKVAMRAAGSLSALTPAFRRAPREQLQPLDGDEIVDALDSVWPM